MQLVLHRVRVSRGICAFWKCDALTIVMLEPSNTEIVGGHVDELEAGQPEAFLASLKERLEDAAEHKPSTGRRRIMKPPHAPVPRTRLPKVEPSAPQQRPAATPSRRPSRAASAAASTKIDRLYEQYPSQFTSSGPSAPSRPEPKSDEYDMEFEANASFMRHVEDVEAQASRKGDQTSFDWDADDLDEDVLAAAVETASSAPWANNGSHEMPFEVIDVDEKRQRRSRAGKRRRKSSDSDKENDIIEISD